VLLRPRGRFGAQWLHPTCLLTRQSVLLCLTPLAGMTGRDHVDHSHSGAGGPSLSLSRTWLTGPPPPPTWSPDYIGITLFHAGTNCARYQQVGSVTPHHAVDSAGGETRHRVYALWLIAQILLGHTDGGLLTRMWARSTGQCSNLQSLPPRTQSGKEQRWTTSIRHASSPQLPVTVRDALSPRPLAPTRICPPCRWNQAIRT
jgi:hypothetical protein